MHKQFNPHSQSLRLVEPIGPLDDVPDAVQRDKVDRFFDLKDQRSAQLRDKQTSDKTRLLKLQRTIDHSVKSRKTNKGVSYLLTTMPRFDPVLWKRYQDFVALRRPFQVADRDTFLTLRNDIRIHYQYNIVNYVGVWHISGSFYYQSHQNVELEIVDGFADGQPWADEWTDELNPENQQISTSLGDLKLWSAEVTIDQIDCCYLINANVDWEIHLRGNVLEFNPETFIDMLSEQSEELFSLLGKDAYFDYDYIRFSLDPAFTLPKMIDLVREFDIVELENE